MAQMCFGYKTISKATGKPNGGMSVRTAACWAPLKVSQPDSVISEVTWVPEHGASAHVKLLLPLMFKDVKVEEIECPRGANSDKLHYAVRFSNLENVYRHNFMFRMFIIRNIDRDISCRKSFEYLIKYGANPLLAAAVAANIEIRQGFGANNTQLCAKGYACCFNMGVTVADVKAFGRDPTQLRNKMDWKFSEGRGFGYKPESEDIAGRVQYQSDAIMKTCTGYTPSRAQFASPTWGGGVQKFMAKLFKDKSFLALSLGTDVNNTKVVR